MPEAGTVFAMPLADGRTGVCRILQRVLGTGVPMGKWTPYALVAASDWIALEPPPIGHPAVRRILVLNHHNWKGKQELTWVDEPPPKEFRQLGCINLTPEDMEILCNAYGSWSCGIQVLLQWRWDNEREKVLAEDKEKEASDLALRMEAMRKRTEQLTKSSFSKLLAKDLFPTWKDYPPKAAKEGCRRIIRAFIQTLAEAKAPLKRDFVATELKKCVEELNQLDTHKNFIETIEREDLCEVLHEVLHAAKFPELSDEIENWRDW
ncbi:MAG: hypothetical protein JF609_00435 [Verrucomicrobia bacterium]|nr:hypothetical protein [Verrucomicrobiota bacterium]